VSTAALTFVLPSGAAPPNLWLLSDAVRTHDVDGDGQLRLLAAMDVRKFRMLTALTHAKDVANTYERPQSLARPQPFVCSDGRTYWLKADAQHGLAAELIGCRMAALINAGPRAEIVYLPKHALPEDGSANHLEGYCVGVLDLPDCLNAKNELQPLIREGAFDVNVVDAASRARVIVFQSWLGAEDPQVLVNVRRGTVHSVDHGAAFRDPQTTTRPVVQLTPIPGVAASVGQDLHLLTPAVTDVIATTGMDLLEAVAGLAPGSPWEDGKWQGGLRRRREIAGWLGERRIPLREVIEEWALT
jgi:hypothetical protein